MMIYLCCQRRKNNWNGGCMRYKSFTSRRIKMLLGLAMIIQELNACLEVASPQTTRKECRRNAQGRTIECTVTNSVKLAVSPTGSDRMCPDEERRRKTSWNVTD